jgi:hypothetical protein
MNETIWHTTEELYAEFGKEYVNSMFNDPSFISDVEHGFKVLKNDFLVEIDWDKVREMPLLHRVLIVFFEIQSDRGSQNDMCKMAQLSPKTYRKYRDENIEDFTEQLMEYENQIKEKVRNIILWIISDFARVSTKELNRLGIEYERFSKLMEAKGYPYDVEDFWECLNSLTPTERVELGMSAA